MRERPFQHNALKEILTTGVQTGSDLDRFAASGRSIEWPMTIVTQSSGTPANLVNLNISSRYIRSNNFVMAWANIYNTDALGTSFGSADGWIFSLPTPLAVGDVSTTWGIRIGSWGLLNRTAGNSLEGYVHGYGGDPTINGACVLLYHSAWPLGTPTAWNSAGAMGLQGHGQLTFSVTYEAPDGFSL